MIIITGATSGIGEATARAFAAQKEELCLLGRRQERLDALKAELSKTSGRPVHVFAFDIRDHRALEAWAQDFAHGLERCEVLVNNAGLSKGFKSFQDGAMADFQEMLETNVLSVVKLTKIVLPHLLKKGAERKRADIVFLGSVAAEHAYPNGNIYCATKAAIHSLVDGIRHDLLGKGVRVVEIAPGMVETEFSEVRFGDKAKAKAVYAGLTPLTGPDIAEAIVWCVNRPKHFNVRNMVLYPTEQASPTSVYRAP